MNSNDQTQSKSDIKYKKRGRPTGKNRVPLTLQERRARNANYERERREAASEAMSLLAEAAGCDPNLSRSEILATVVNELQQAGQITATSDIAELKRLNKKLIDQVDSLEQRLSNEEQKENDIAKDNDYVSGVKRKNLGTKKTKKNKKAKS